ncbi:MAG TPA: hypothetical protein VLX92_13160 [Kofleriaceae bacterium]|nr:hypothetical protein [Kofleriaceae bacterium]
MKLALVVLVALCAVARAQPGMAPPPPRAASDVLRDANAAATAGDWRRVELLVEPLLAQPLAAADLGEANRLAGLAAFFEGRRAAAEQHFLVFLHVELDGHLDPALYPPDVVVFFDELRARHAAELRARRPRAKRTFLLSFVPPFGQFQNGEPTKGWVIAGLLGVFAASNVSSYFVLRSWCSPSDKTCDARGDHTHAANTLRTVNFAAGIGLIATYLYGVYDGVVGYRRQSREQLAPYATAGGGVVGVGIVGSF